MKVLFAPASRRADLTEGPLRAAGIQVRMVPYTSSGPLARLSLAQRTARATLLAPADILLTDICSSRALLFTLPANLRRLPLVLRPQGDSWQEDEDLRLQRRAGRLRSLLDPGLLNLFYRRAQAILPVSKFLGKVILRNTKVNADTITPIPLAVDTSRFAPAARPAHLKDQLGWQAEHIVSLVLNFTYVQKLAGLEAFLPVLRALVEKYADVAVVIAGDGPLRRDFQERKRDVLDHPRILLPGHLANIENLYQCSDVLAHFSFLDACPNVLVEAWASETPVVVNDYEPLLEKLKPGENGYVLSNEADVDAALSIFERLLYDPDHRSELGRRGRRMVVEQLSQASLGRHLREALEKLL